MTPSIDHRLDSIVRAIQEAILPSLGAHQSLAIEQAHLILGQIAIIRQQLDLAPLVERREAEAMAALAHALLDDAQGGGETMAAAQALRAAVEGASDDGAAAVRATANRIGCAIEALIAASGIDGDEAFKARSLAIVIDAGRRTATLERALNRASGFEAAGTNLPEVADLLAR